MCSRSTASIASAPQFGQYEFGDQPSIGFRRSRLAADRDMLRKVALGEVPRPSARRADADGAGEGSSPALMRAISMAALRRAWSAEITPWRPTAIRVDFPWARVWTT